MNGISRAFVLRALLYWACGSWSTRAPSLRNLVVGVLASAAAAWASVRLLPPASGRVRMGALLLLLPRFLWQSLVAGLDVARRAFAPRLDLQPGFVEYRTQLPPGSARSAFELIASLMPGSVPSDEREQTDRVPLPGRAPAGGRAAGRRRACLCQGLAAGAAPWLISCSRRAPSSC